MSWRNTLLLAIAAAAVALLAYLDVTSQDPDAGWDTVFEEARPTPPSEDIERLVEFDPRDVIAIRIKRAGTTLRSQRTAYGWSDTTKPRAIADLLDGVAQLAVILTIEEEPSDADLDAYGLAPPHAIIALERDEGPAISILLGNHNPSSTAIYARVTGRTGIVLTGAVAMWDVEKAMSALSATPPG